MEGEGKVRGQEVNTGGKKDREIEGTGEKKKSGGEM